MNKNIIGHEKNIKLLQKTLQGDGLHHSFLFVGPENVGKQVIAKSLANNIVNGDLNKSLQICKHLDSDINVISPQIIEKKTKKIIRDISIETIIDAMRFIALTPDKKARVLIIDDAHKMTFSAQNALLKTLEEPLDNRYIILITHNIDGLLKTIQSRCFVLQFGVVSTSELNVEYGNDEYLNDINGRPGFLYRIHNDDKFRSMVESARHELQTFAHKTKYERLNLALELSKKDDIYLQFFFQVWVYRIRAAAYKTKKFQLIQIADKIECLLNKINSTNINKQLALEDLLINIM